MQSMPYISTTMLNLLNRNLRRLCRRLRWPSATHRRNSKPKIFVQKLGTKSNSKSVYPNVQLCDPNARKTIRVATFNASLFSMAPAVPQPINSPSRNHYDRDTWRSKSLDDHRPKSILKQSPLHPSKNTADLQQKFLKSRLRVSINLPDNEISMGRSGRLERLEDEKKKERWSFTGRRAVVEVMKEVEADIWALQDVKAEEEKEMRPLSELAAALGMHYVFAESWAPEYGNAVLSRWPIKRWKVQKIFDDTDFRNVLKATIEVPKVGDVNLYCTHLDHLDETWRMKQIHAIIDSHDAPHILAGGLNSLDETDYSTERWTNIVKYYEEMGKPAPKAEVMRYLKGKQYTDAKDFTGECESVVMIAKGQSVQGTCKYGTRVDYIMGSPGLAYKFIPGSYSVLSSKATSHHHIVKVDIAKMDSIQDLVTNQNRHPPSHKRVVKLTHHDSPSKAIWSTDIR